MIKDQLIIITSNLDWNFPCDYEQQTAKVLAKTNKVIVFNPIESFYLGKVFFDAKKRVRVFGWPKALKKNLSIFPSFYLIPFHRLEFVRKINYKTTVRIFKLFMKIFASTTKKRPILWMFFPQHHIFINKLGEKLSIYDCVDYHTSLNKTEKKIKQDNEKKMFEKVDVVFTNSPALFRLKKSFHPRVNQVAQGFNTKKFLQPKTKKVPECLRDISKPIIGFAGSIDHRLDFATIKRLALDNHRWSFVFIGPVLRDPNQAKIVNLSQNLKDIFKLKNVFRIKRQTKKQLVVCIDYFDICWIPYNPKLEYVKYSYPMKVFEYFARGKPVITSEIESLKPLVPYLSVCKKKVEFEKEIKLMLKGKWPEKKVKKQRELAIANSWKAKIEQISQIILKNYREEFIS